MNVELLTKVRDRFVADPRALDMWQWAMRSAVADCGTVGCIAGHAVEISDGAAKAYALARATDFADPHQVAPMDRALQRRAIELLQITREQASRLFCVCGWPKPFERRYKFDPSGDNARTVRDRIDAFIASGGAV